MAVLANSVQTYYVPLPEDDLFETFDTINSVAAGDVNNVISELIRKVNLKKPESLAMIIFGYPVVKLFYFSASLILQENSCKNISRCKFSVDEKVGIG